MPEVAHRRILIIGDSLSSGASSPGGKLARDLTAEGATVRVNAKVGRSAWNFYGSEDAAAQLSAAAAFDPHIAIVQLGTNDIGLSLSADQNRMTQLRDALARGGKTEVWAVGPPSFPASASESKGVDGVAAMMSRVFARHFIDMRPITRDLLVPERGRAADGVHFTATGGEIAGHRVSRVFLDAQDAGIGMFTIMLFGALAWALLR